MASKDSSTFQTVVTEKEVIEARDNAPVNTEANEAVVTAPERNLTQATWTVVWGVALPCIPVFVITFVLLYIIFHHRLVLQPGWSALEIPKTITHLNKTSLVNQIRQDGGSAAYYVQYNPSTITTIASWTSRIVPYLSSSVMALVAFYVARHIVTKTRQGDGSQLPSPEQLTILISILSGNGFGPLKDTLVHRLVRKKKLVDPLPAAFSALAIITFLGIVIPLIDTWFGVATKSVTVIQLTTRSPQLSYGNEISTSSCPNGPRDNGTVNPYLWNSTAFWPCTVDTATGHQLTYVAGLAEASGVQLQASKSTAVRNYTDNTGTTYYYLGHPSQSATVDYQARTFATSSQCRPMTLQQCNVTIGNSENSTTLFNCNSAFAGDFELPALSSSAYGNESTQTLPNVGVAFSGDAQLTDVNGQLLAHSIDMLYNYTYQEIYSTNPLFYGVWAQGYPSPDLTDTSDFRGDDSYYYETTKTGGVWILNCSTTVYDITYTWVNGAVRTFNKTLASPDLAALFSSPFAVTASPDIGYIRNALASVATVAGAANSSSGIANTWSVEFSKTLLAYSIAALEPKLNDLEQSRNASIVVARVPLVPLYLLLGTKVLYVIVVIALGIGVFCFTQPAETEFVKSQLSIRGLASAYFDRPDLIRQSVVQQIQTRLDPTKGKDGTSSKGDEKDPSVSGTKSMATSPPEEASPPSQARVGLIPTAEGTWQFVTMANGVWNSVKPVIKSVVVTEAKAGGLGSVGEIIRELSK